MAKASESGILEHLRELRKRVLWCVLAVAVGMIVAFWQYDWIIRFLEQPAGNVQFIYNRLTEGFSVSMRVSFMVGIVIAMPVIMYNVLAFIVPALGSKERRVIFLGLPFILLMFFSGVMFGWRFLIPPAIGFLTNFGTDVAVYMINMGDYVDFITRLILVIGLIFEMPVIATFLGSIGLLSARWLMRKWKIVFIGSFIVAAVVTPTPDIVNQSIVAGTLFLLFIVSIGMTWLAQKLRERRKRAVVSLAD